MRKIILMLFAIILTSVGYAQGSMDFEDEAVNLPSTTSYTDGSFEVDGITYSYTGAKNEYVSANESYPINDRGLLMRRGNEGSFYWTISNGVGNLSFNYRKAFTGGNDRQIKVTVTDSGSNETVYTTPLFGSGSGTQSAIYEFNEDLNLGGSVTIKIEPVGTGSRHVTVDDIIWTAYGDEGGEGPEEPGDECDAPTGLSITDITTESDDHPVWKATWTAGNAGVWEWSLNDGMGVIGGQVSTNEVTLDLAYDTTYTFSVYSVCDDEQSSSVTQTFETGAEPTEPEVGCVVDSGDWDGYETFDNFTPTSNQYKTDTFTGQDGSEWSYFYAAGDKQINGNTPKLSNNHVNRPGGGIVTSGVLTSGISTLQFAFMQAESGNVNMDVYIIDSNNNEHYVYNATTYSESGIKKCSGVIDLADLGLNITGNFQLKFANPNGAQVSIDDIIWTSNDNGSEPEECLAPTNIQTEVSYDSVTVSWTGAANADIFVRGTGDATPDPNTAPTYSGVSSPYEITFTDHAERMFYVRNNCGADDYSEWITDNQYVYNPAEDECRFRFEFITQGEVDFFPQVIDEETGEYYLDAHFTIEDGYYSHTVWSANPVYFTMDFQGWNEAGTSITVYGFVGDPLGNNEELVYSEYIELDEDSEFVDAYLDCDLNPSEPEVGCVVDSGDWDGYETFDNSGVSETANTHVNGTFEGQDGSTWTYTQVRGDFSIHGKALTLGRNRTPSAEVTSGVLEGGISSLQFSYMLAFGTNVGLEVYVVNDAHPDGLLVATITSDNQLEEALCSGEIDLSTHNIYGDFQLSFRNPSGAGQVSIDDITWTGNEAPDLPCDISVELVPGMLLFMDGMVGVIPFDENSCIDEGGSFVVEINLSGSSNNSSYVITDNQGSAPITGTVPGGFYYFEYNAGVNPTITVIGEQDDTCNFTVSTNSPEFCAAPCVVPTFSYIWGNMDNGIVVEADCIDEGEEYYVAVTLTGGSGNASYTLLDSDTEYDDATTTDGPYIFGPYAASSTNEILWKGNDDGDCEGSLSVSAEVCIPEPCEAPTLSYIWGNMDNGEVVATDCIDEDGQYYVAVEISGGSGNDTYTLFDDSNEYETATTTGGSYIFGPYDAITQNEILYYGNDDSGCDGSITVSADVCEPVLCEISLSAVAQTDCVDADGTYEVYVTLSGSSGESSYTIIDGDLNELKTDAVIGETYTFSFAAGEDVEIYAYGNDDDSCDTEVAQVVESPELCASPCTPPTDIIFYDLTHNSTRLSWSQEGSVVEWNVYYGLEGTDFDTQTNGYIGSYFIESNPTPGAILDGLDPGITYDVQVTAVCMGYTESVSLNGTFTTLALPCAINLSAVAQTECVDADGTYEVYVTLSGSSAETSYTIIDGDLNELKTDAVIGETYTFSFAAGNDVEIYAYGNDDDSCDTDVVEVASPAICIPPCDAPTNLMISDITHESALVSWSQTGTPVKWIVSYGLQGFDYNTEGTDVYVNFAEGFSVVLTGLAPESTYDVYVYAVCEDNTSTLTGPEIFSTPAAPIVCDEENYYISYVGAFLPGSGVVINENSSDFDTDTQPAGVTTPGYGDYSDKFLVINKAVDTGFNFTIEAEGPRDGLTYTVEVWVDRNLDGEFADGPYLENVYGASNDTGVFTGEFDLSNLPEYFDGCDHPEGQYTMRIILTVQDDDCGMVYGETEDYTLEVTGECDGNMSVEVQPFENFTFYPNPVETEINLNATSVIESVQVYNLLGQKVIETTPNTTQTQINTESLSSGVYMMKVSIEGAEKTFKVVRK